jgi:hypothetical protein
MGYKNKRDTNKLKKRKTFFPKLLALDFFAMRIGIIKTRYFLGAKLLFNKANSWCIHLPKSLPLVNNITYRSPVLAATK